MLKLWTKNIMLTTGVTTWTSFNWNTCITYSDNLCLQNMTPLFSFSCSVNVAITETHNFCLSSIYFSFFPSFFLKRNFQTVNPTKSLLTMYLVYFGVIVCIKTLHASVYINTYINEVFIFFWLRWCPTYFGESIQCGWQYLNEDAPSAWWTIWCNGPSICHHGWEQLKASFTNCF